MTKNILTVQDLTVRLDNTIIIQNLSFELNKGEVLVILGPNGSGKSVLLRTILGFLPYTGEIKWNYKHKIGYLPQGLNQLLAKNLPITVNDFFSLKDEKYPLETINQYFSLVGLDAKNGTKLLGNLSGGEFQRMLLAWVLIDEPEILILDEPTTGIDLGGGETIYSLLKRIKQEKGLTIILVTHDLNIVYDFSDKVLCLTRKGHLCFGPPQKVMSPQMLENLYGAKLKFYEHH